MNEARKLIETSARRLCRDEEAEQCVLGQVPHHFIYSGWCDGGRVTEGVSLGDFCSCKPSLSPNPDIRDCVTFQALSGASQTGPNVFWSLAALHYAAVSGNMTWLADFMPQLRYAASFLLEMYDPAQHMLKATGPLWIDTFIRENYTTDSNAGMVMLSRRLAVAEAVFGNASGAHFFDELADNITTGMNAMLWLGDHYASYGSLDTPVRERVAARPLNSASNVGPQAAGGASSGAFVIFDRVDYGATAWPRDSTRCCWH